MHPNVLSSIIYDSQDTEATQVSINRWTGKDVVNMHTHTMEYYSAVKRIDFCNMLSETSLTEIDKYSM